MRLLFVVNRLTVFLSFCYIYKDFVRQLKAFPPSLSHFCACERNKTTHLYSFFHVQRCLGTRWLFSGYLLSEPIKLDFVSFNDKHLQRRRTLSERDFPILNSYTSQVVARTRKFVTSLVFILPREPTHIPCDPFFKIQDFSIRFTLTVEHPSVPGCLKFI